MWCGQVDPAAVGVGLARRGGERARAAGRGGLRDPPHAQRAHRAALHAILLRAHQDHTQPGDRSQPPGACSFASTLFRQLLCVY